MFFHKLQPPSAELHEPWVPSPNPHNFYSGRHSGKWCIICTDDNVDARWSTVCDLVRQRQLLFAKASTKMARRVTGHATYVICVFTRDWRDETELMAAREVLRAAGFAEELGYKRDEETRKNVYGTPDEFYRRA